MNKQYIVTERAHLMCPNMQFGICAKINSIYNESKIRKVLEQLQENHPFLHSLIAQENSTDKLYYDSTKEFTIECTIMKDFSNIYKDYSAILLRGWNVYEEGLLKVLVYPADKEFQVLFIAHHLLGDGRAILGLMLEFADLYVIGKEPEYVEETLITSCKDLPSGSKLPLLSRIVINNVNKQWIKENDKVKYCDYLTFEKQFLQKNKISYENIAMRTEDLVEMVNECRKNQVSVNDYLVAKLMIQEKVSKVVIAADIRDQLDCYKDGALGNYATAMAITSKKKTTDVIIKAKDVKTEINKRMSDNQSKMLVLACYLQMIPELIDAVAISTLGEFESNAGKFVGGKMFGYETRSGYCMTNLGRINTPNILEAIFIPPASPANKLTVGILTVNDKMNICKARAL